MNDNKSLFGSGAGTIEGIGLEATKVSSSFPFFSLLVQAGEEKAVDVSALHAILCTGADHADEDENGLKQKIEELNVIRDESIGQNATQSILVHSFKANPTSKCKKASTALVVRKTKPSTPDRIRAQAARLYDDIHHLIDQYNLRKQRERYFKAGQRALDANGLQQTLSVMRRSSNVECQQTESRKDGDSSRNSVHSACDEVFPIARVESARGTSRAGPSSLPTPSEELPTSSRAPRTRDGNLVPPSRGVRIKSPFRLPNFKEEFQNSRQKYLEVAEEERHRLFPLEQRKVGGDLQKDPSSFSLRFQTKVPLK